MIDVNLPLELDDGTPVKLVEVTKHSVRVRLPKPPRRTGEGAASVWAYNPVTGVFLGGNRKLHYVLQNSCVNAEPEDWS